MTSVAVLLTCFNRRDLTLACLRALHAQHDVDDVELRIFLVDDGSSDGTGDAVRSEFPDATVIDGDGNYFWNRGMCAAWEAALAAGPHDYHLLVNDDTILVDDALAELLRESVDADDKAVIAGTINSAETGETTYGGYIAASGWNAMKVEVREPNDTTPCVTLNMNCVLVPDGVVAEVGTLDPVFHHSFGDIDYGYRATKAGVEIIATSRYIGSCEFHSGSHGYADPGMSLRERIAFIRSLKGLNGRDWRVLTFRHGGLFAPVVWVSPYLNVLKVHLREKLGR